MTNLHSADWLQVAAGTAYEADVYDCRRYASWSRYAGLQRAGQPRLIVYHHTAGAQHRYVNPEAALETLEPYSRKLSYGLPYNILVVRAPLPMALYLNDCDLSYPHTLGHNDAFAIALEGDFTDVEPEPELVACMTRTADAFATMWGIWVPECGHRQVSPTACPGDKLFAALDSARDLMAPA